jgi:hypothetical protein
MLRSFSIDFMIDHLASQVLMLFLEKYLVALKKNKRGLKRFENQYACYSKVTYLFFEIENCLKMLWISFIP